MAVWQILVDDVPVVEQNERVLERRHDITGLAFGGVSPLLGLAALNLDALLLGLQHLFGDTAVIEELDKLLLLAGQFMQAAVVALGLATGDIGLALNVGLHGPADVVLLAWLIGLALVAPYDGAFGALHREVGRRAALAALYAAQAAEVLIDTAAFATVPSVAQALAASTEQRSLQVVVVLVGTVSTGTVAVEDPLHLVKGRLVDQGIVATLALDAVAGDDSQVEVVAKDAMHGSAGQRALGPRAGGPGLHAGILKDVRNGRDGVLIGGSEVERELDVLRALGIGSNGGNIGSVVALLNDVEVAQTSRTVGAAVSKLTVQPHLDLHSIIA
ncbi:MAG: hypothetical protein WA484_04470 [Solirubrobacteraceae bacterium]